MSRKIFIKNIEISNNQPFTLLSGPCQLETRDHALKIADFLSNLCKKLNINFIFKASYDKANRTSIKSERGVGLEKGLRILAEIRREFNCPVVTDVHHPADCDQVASEVDILQIPAFLCRQTDLLLAAGRTKIPINIKKGQFQAPWDMTHIIDKILYTGNKNIMLCERGTTFGYNSLITDMRSLSIMGETGYPVVIDATHSVQQPGGMGCTSGGQKQYIHVIAKAAVAVGVAAVFLETHDNPSIAPSDGANMLNLGEMENLLTMLKNIDHAVKCTDGKRA